MSVANGNHMAVDDDLDGKLVLFAQFLNNKINIDGTVDPDSRSREEQIVSEKIINEGKLLRELFDGELHSHWS